MIPFRPTPDRMYEALQQLHYDNRKADGYEYVVGPHLYAEMRRAPAYWTYVSPDGSRAFGLPLKIDPRLPRGWISLRHDVTR